MWLLGRHKEASMARTCQGMLIFERTLLKNEMTGTLYLDLTASNKLDSVPHQFQNERSKARKSVSKKFLMAQNCPIFLNRFLKNSKAFISRQFSRKVAGDTFFDTL
jgi:hypothetical protein